jgi:phosphopantothenoylcysteine decarboxylase/phosphopantothenate--cysteine ligase
MCAAVADWRPDTSSQRKRSKGDMPPTLALERNPDILAELGARFGVDGAEDGPLLVGFAAESHDLVESGRDKLARKGAHMLVANLIGGASSAFGARSSSIVVLTADGASYPYGPAPKDELARRIWERVERQMRRREQTEEPARADEPTGESPEETPA